MGEFTQDELKDVRWPNGVGPSDSDLRLIEELNNKGFFISWSRSSGIQEFGQPSGWWLTLSRPTSKINSRAWAWYDNAHDFSKGLALLYNYYLDENLEY